MVSDHPPRLFPQGDFRFHGRYGRDQFVWRGFFQAPPTRDLSHKSSAPNVAQDCGRRQSNCSFQFLRVEFRDAENQLEVCVAFDCLEVAYLAVWRASQARYTVDARSAPSWRRARFSSMMGFGTESRGNGRSMSAATERSRFAWLDGKPARIASDIALGCILLSAGLFAVLNSGGRSPADLGPGPEFLSRSHRQAAVGERRRACPSRRRARSCARFALASMAARAHRGAYRGNRPCRLGMGRRSGAADGAAGDCHALGLRIGRGDRARAPVARPRHGPGATRPVARHGRPRPGDRDLAPDLRLRCADRGNFAGARAVRIVHRRRRRALPRFAGAVRGTLCAPGRELARAGNRGLGRDRPARRSRARPAPALVFMPIG